MTNLSDAMKLNLIKFILPFIIFIFMWLVVIITSIIGIWLSLKYNDWTIFGRFGSIIVVFALISATLDYYKFGSAISKFMEEYSKENENKIFKKSIKEKLENFNLKKSENEINFLAEQLAKIHFESSPYRFSYHLKNMFYKHEFLIAAYGTLVWGFGDLLGKISF